MYMHMLGYPSHFGQMEALKLVASPGFAGKRIGYLALAVLLDERQEVLMLVTNSLKNDLNSADQYVTGLALAALAAVASKGMAVDLAPEVARLCCHSSAYVRKKAAAAAVRLLSRAPEEVVANFVDVPIALVGDRHHGVVLAGCSLARAVASTASAVGNATGDEELRGVAASYARELPSTICRALRGLLAAGGGATEHDAGGVCDPFLQVALLRLLRALWELAGGSVRPHDADAAADVVAAVAASTDAGLPPVGESDGGAASSSLPAGTKHGASGSSSSRRQQQEQQQAPGMGGGAAVLYEASRTALALAGVGGRKAPAFDGGSTFGRSSFSASASASSASVASASASAAAAGSRLLADGGASLRVLAVGVLGRFLSSRDHNLRYVALDALSRVAAREPAAVQRHRSTVVACVRDGDAATRRAALELVCALATRGNAAALARELTDYLPLADAGFRPVLAARICAMARRHAGAGADGRRWLVEATLRVLAALGGGGGGGGGGARSPSSSARRGGVGFGSSGSNGGVSHIDESVPRSLVVTITNAPELHAFAARALYEVLAGAVGSSSDESSPAAADAAAARLPPPALLRVAVWVVGEYSDLLIASPAPGVLEGEELDDAAKGGLAAADVARTLERVLAASASSIAALSSSDSNAGFAAPVPAVDVRAAVLTALAKLAARSPGGREGGGGGDAGTRSRVVGVEGAFARSADVEVQTRACEYGALLSSDSPASESLAAAVLERLPPLDEAAHNAALDVEPVTEEEAAAALAASAGGGGGSGGGAFATTADSLLGDLMSLEVPVSSHSAAPAAAGGSSSSQPAADALADIFGSVDLLSAPAAPAAAAAAETGAAASPPSKATPLPEDLFAAPLSHVASATAPAPAPAAAGTAEAEAGTAASAPSDVVLHSTTALSDAASGLELTLAFSKPDAVASPEDTVVVATARRSTGSSEGVLTNFGIQAAVPKYAKLRLDPATGTVLDGGDSFGKNVITQRLYLTNTAHGSKPLALRLRVSWTPPGASEPRLEMVEVKDLPETL